MFEKPIMSKVTKQAHLQQMLMNYIFLIQLHLAIVKDFEIELDIAYIRESTTLNSCIL